MEKILNTNFDLNLWSFLWIALLGFVCSLFFRLTESILIPLLGSFKVRKKVAEIVPITKRVFWAFFALFSAFAFIKQNQLAGIVTILILSIGAWNFIQNYIVGIILMMGDVFKVGQHIKFNEYKGVIRALKTTSCQMELDNGEMILIPFSKFSNGMVIKASPSDKTINQRFIFSDIEIENQSKFKEKLAFQLLNLPWVLPNQNPLIEITKNGASGYNVEVIVQGISKHHHEKIEKNLKLFLKI